MMNPIFHERRYLIPFRTALLPQIFTDVLVIGGGVAGLRAAIAASDQAADVIIACKGRLTDSNTFLAQGGIAAVVPDPPQPQARGEHDPPPTDCSDNHADDTLQAGAGLCDEPVVRTIVDSAPDEIAQLLREGMRFDRTRPDDVDSALALGREGGHRRARILHSHGDATGKELVATLHRRANASDQIRLFYDCFVLDLLTIETSNGLPARQCVGAITHHPKFGLQVIWARSTILASGGCGQVWRESTNPFVATGDGLAMAYRAGASLADLAFMQFHPTTLYIAGASRSLISEAVRGEEAVLIDRHGHRFMADYDPQADLAPRDVVSRSILAQIAKTRDSHVFLDCRPIGGPRFAQRFPGIHRLLSTVWDRSQAKTPYPCTHRRTTWWAGCTPISRGDTNLPGLCSPAGRRPAQGCTGLTGWPATVCSKAWSVEHWPGNSAAKGEPNGPNGQPVDRAAAAPAGGPGRLRSSRTSAYLTGQRSMSRTCGQACVR